MPAATQHRHPLAILTGVALLVVMAVVIIWQVQRSHPPIDVADAGVSGEVWTMPSDQVQSFLLARGVDALPPAIDGTSVVARVAWFTDIAEGMFTVLLGDERARSGVIQYVYGPPDGSVTLGNGSMWDDALAEHDWLVGDGTQPVPTGGLQLIRAVCLRAIQMIRRCLGGRACGHTAERFNRASAGFGF